MIDSGKLLHLQGALLWLPCTLLLYAGSCALHRRLDKAPIANPTLLTIGGLVLILACSGVTYKVYFESVAVLHYLLGTAVVALALPLYRNAARLRGRCVSMALALVAGSLASILVGLSIAMLAHASASTVVIFHRIHPHPKIQRDLDRGRGAGYEKPRARNLGGFASITAMLCMVARRLLWALHESRRRRAAIILREYAHLLPPRSGGDDDV